MRILSVTIASQKSEPKLRSVFCRIFSFSGTRLGIVPKTGLIHLNNRGHTAGHSKKVITHTRSHRNPRGNTSTRRNRVPPQRGTSRKGQPTRRVHGHPHDTLSVPVARRHPLVIYDTLSYYTMRYIYTYIYTWLYYTTLYDTRIVYICRYIYITIYYTILYYTILYCTVLYYIILYSTILPCIVLCDKLVCYTILYHTGL